MIDFRPTRYEDLKAFNQIRNLSREWLHDSREFTLKQTQEWWQSNEDSGEGPSYWSIIQYDNIFDGGELMIGYFRADIVDGYADTAWQIGADLHPDFRGRGIAKRLYPEFMRMCIRAFDATDFHLSVLPHNLRAGKLYHSLGFEQISQPDESDIRMAMSAERFRELYG